MVFSEDDSLLISGSEDGTVRVWSLFMYFSLPFSIFLSVAVVIFPFVIVYGLGASSANYCSICCSSFRGSGYSMISEGSRQIIFMSIVFQDTPCA